MDQLPQATTPEDIPRLFTEAWNARRADWLASLFEEEADFINVVGIWWENRADIQKAHDYGLRIIFNESTLKIGRVKTKPLGDSHAVVHARMRLTGQTPKAQAAASIRNNLFLFVVRKHGDHWLCLSAQNTDIVPGAETHLRNEKGELVPTDYRS